MKTLFRVLILGGMLGSHTPLFANVIVVPKTIVQDTIISTFQANSVDFRNVYASGKVEFSSKSGYMRIILSNNQGYDLLVYESIPLLARDGVDNFSNKAIESLNVPHNLEISKVRVELKNAKLSNLIINASDARILRAQQKIISESKIDILNQNLREQDALWVAGETPLSQMSYEEKKAVFGGTVPEFNGFEYYVGGIFEIEPDARYDMPQNVSASLVDLPSSFDWRNRHGANNPSSPYYNREGTGWITQVKDQSEPTYCGSCWAFAALGVVEAATNLYFNRFINPDLSEQELISCNTDGDDCSGGLPQNSLSYVKSNGVVDEKTFPYQGSYTPGCSAKGANLKEQIRIDDYSISTPRTFDALKQEVLQSPVTLGVRSWKHAMALVGYKILEAGDKEIYISDEEGFDYSKIQEGDFRIGQTVWIFKNSFGSSWGENKGYVYLLASDMSKFYCFSKPLLPVYSKNYSRVNIRCLDMDGDGWYWWGIGPKPATCPSNAPDIPDDDDSTPKGASQFCYTINHTPLTGLPFKSTRLDVILFKNAPSLTGFSFDSYGSLIKVYDDLLCNQRSYHYGASVSLYRKLAGYNLGGNHLVAIDVYDKACSTIMLCIVEPSGRILHFVDAAVNYGGMLLKQFEITEDGRIIIYTIKPTTATSIIWNTPWISFEGVRTDETFVIANGKFKQRERRVYGSKIYYKNDLKKYIRPYTNYQSGVTTSVDNEIWNGQEILEAIYIQK